MENNNIKLTHKKGFKGTLGIFGVAVIALAITLPIVLLTGSSEKKQFDTKQQVGSTQTPTDWTEEGNVNVTQSTHGVGKLISINGNGDDNGDDNLGIDRSTKIEAPTKQSQIVVNNLSLNTIYCGWYSMIDYRNTQEFIDFQNEGVLNIQKSYKYSMNAVEGLPTLPDNATQEEIDMFGTLINQYRNNMKQDETLLWVITDTFEAGQNTSFSDDFGKISLAYFGNSNSFAIISQFKGSIQITQEQIDTNSSSLPNVYQYNIEVLDELTNYILAFYSGVEENLKGLITEEKYNLIPVVKPPFEEVKNYCEEYLESMFDLEVTNIISN